MYVLPLLPELNSEEEEDDTTNSDYTAAMEKYLEYWELTWLGKVNRRTGIRGRPRFKHELWNKFDTVKDKSEDLTNNNSEAYVQSCYEADDSYEAKPLCYLERNSG